MGLRRGTLSPGCIWFYSLFFFILRDAAAAYIYIYTVL